MSKRNVVNDLDINRRVGDVRVENSLPKGSGTSSAVTRRFQATVLGVMVMFVCVTVATTSSSVFTGAPPSVPVGQLETPPPVGSLAGALHPKVTSGNLVTDLGLPGDTSQPPAATLATLVVDLQTPPPLSVGDTSQPPTATLATLVVDLQTPPPLSVGDTSQPLVATSQAKPKKELSWLYAPSSELRAFKVQEALGMTPSNAAATCELMLLGNENCKMESGEETMNECIKRLGPLEITKALQPQCTRSEFWLSKVSALRGENLTREGLNKALQDVPIAAFTPLRDRQIKATLPLPRRYVPPHERSIGQFGKPYECSFGKVYPLGFLMPKMNFIPRVSRNKIFDWSPVTVATWKGAPLQPFPQRPMSFVDEYMSSLMYEHSHFAWTHLRGGFECLRHLEIMARGAIPMFPDYHRCEHGECLRGMPLHLFKEAWQLPGLEHLQVNYALDSQSRLEGRAFSNDYMFRLADASSHLAQQERVNFRGPGTINWEKFDVNKYFDLADRILNFTQHHLTGAAGVSYILKTIGLEEPKNILYIGAEGYDYAGGMVECGLGELGLNVSFLDTPAGLWRKNPKDVNVSGEEYVDGFRTHRYHSLQGDGYVLGRRCEAPAHPNLSVDRAREALVRGEYDLVIFVICDDSMGCLGHKVRLLPEISALLDSKVHSTKFAMLTIGDDAPNPHSYADYVKRGLYAFEREPYRLVHPTPGRPSCKAIMD